MYTLHIGNKNYSSWSVRPWVLLTELGIPFHERLHVFGPNFTAKTEGISPTGKVPCLQDGDRTIWDSLAIAEYVAEKRPGVWPKDDTARAWARSAAAEMHSSFGMLREVCSMFCGLRIQLHSFDPVKSDLARLVGLWDDGFRRFGGPFLAGKSFGAVDAFFCPVAFRVQTYGLPLPAPSMAYVERLLALDSMKKWYDAALKEPWRDDPHETGIPQWGRIVRDLRAAATATA
ncbi:MAG TPA: glutathione S-transferase family protein [Usitatibacter sp.]|nr:glutathione S-transferase family protein [Usitatibacter sp.]